MTIQATYSPQGLWGYRLHLVGVSTVRAKKRSASGQTVELQGTIQGVQARTTRLDFTVLPGDENPAIMKAGEQVQIEVFQDEAMIASLIFRREADDSLTVETEHIDLVYLPY